ncbi:hypothetical protein C7444_10372 [Sphaerotilus hippei]|uniref:Uncharacterized protein n=1 Tax=Sphaerotilus hippei TaxID=744406 RepID=A0A318H4B7_9BURK|nr:hypothetical protein [Sphaerotilus hippei]PXW97981.1 hypothetical protein C7444_10372 [Sphaerotilus hippei]
MDASRLKEVATQVLSWQHRLPLAERLQLNQIGAIGTVRLPFRRVGGADPAQQQATTGVTEVTEAAAAPTASSPGRLHALRQAWRSAIRALRSRLPPRLGGITADTEAGADRLQPAFTEDFIAPWSPAQVARWAARHGSTEPPGEADWPCREVAVEPPPGGGDGTETVWLHLLTAAIVRTGASGEDRQRLLIAPAGGGRPVVLGRRRLSRRRIAAAAGLALLLILLPAAAWRWWPGATGGAAAHAAAPAASVAASAARAASAAEVDKVATAASAEPTSPAASGVPDGTAEAASAAVEGRTAASGPMPAASAAPASAPRVDPPPPGYYALVSRGPHTTARCKELFERMQVAQQRHGPTDPPSRTELMTGRDGSCHAVWWPFTSRDEATRARWSLATRGVTVDVVEF